MLTNAPTTYEIGQRFTFAVGDKVICNGFPMVVSEVCDGQLAGMVVAKTERGSVCVSANFPNIYPAPKLCCDGEKGCTGDVTHIDHKGWAYCTEHGLHFKRSRPCRKLTKREITTLLEGGAIRYSR